MTVAYVGQLGTHLVVPHEANNPLPGVGPVATGSTPMIAVRWRVALPNVGNIALTESSGTHELQRAAGQRPPSPVGRTEV